VHGGIKARETSVAALGRQLRSICQFAVIKNDEELDMLKTRSLLTAVAAACLLATSSMSSALAEKKNEFNIAWTIYVGWMPWPYAAETGIVKKWADKYGIKINVTQINDYVE